jgi:1-acyl-sn-glycerol-3-phosphate acyltransferase
MLPVATAQREKEFKLNVKGRENIPKGPAIINMDHQTHQDAATYLEAVAEYISPLAAIDGDSNSKEWFLLETLGVIPVLRGGSELAKKSQKDALNEEVNRLQHGSKVLVAGRGTYGPLLRDMLYNFKGGTIEAANRASEKRGEHIAIIQAICVYVPDTDYNIREAHVEFMKSFNYTIYGTDSVAAAEGLRETALEKKLEMIDTYIPSMTQAEYAEFRKVQAIKYPADRDYYQNARFSLNYRMAKTQDEKEAVERMFQEN